MAKYSGTFSCGHEGYVYAVGPHKTRAWRIEKAFEGLCEECYEKKLAKEREEANRKAEELRKEMEMPNLIGSEKQVAWANTIKAETLEFLEEYIERVKTTGKINRSEMSDEIALCKTAHGLDIVQIVENFLEGMNRVINETSAKLFIDYRNNKLRLLVLKTAEFLKEKATEQENEIVEEVAISGEEVTEEGIVAIDYKDEKIQVKYLKNDKFKDIVKALRFEFNWSTSKWERKLNNMNGSYKDRIAELGNKLLLNGFRVSILETDIRNMAISGEYEKECRRWVAREGKGKLAIKWLDKEGNWYDKTRKLPGTSWENPNIVIKVENYAQLEEFAEMYSFKFTEKARTEIEEYKNRLGNIQTVSVSENTSVIQNGLEDILNSSNEILEDLRED